MFETITTVTIIVFVDNEYTLPSYFSMWLRKPRGWHDWSYVGGRWHTLQGRLYYGTGSEATHSQAGAVVLTNSPYFAYMHEQTHTLFDAGSNMSLILGQYSLYFSSCDHTFSLSHSHVPLSLSHLFCHPLPTQGLYCDIRQLVQFIKEAHGNVFRRVALSALLDSAEKVTTTKKPEEKEEGKQPGPRRYWPISGQEWSSSY